MCADALIARSPLERWAPCEDSADVRGRGRGLSRLLLVCGRSGRQPYDQVEVLHQAPDGEELVAYSLLGLLSERASACGLSE